MQREFPGFRVGKTVDWDLFLLSSLTMSSEGEKSSFLFVTPSTSSPAFPSSRSGLALLYLFG